MVESEIFNTFEGYVVDRSGIPFIALSTIYSDLYGCISDSRKIAEL
jgi:hypothetical protein